MWHVEDDSSTRRVVSQIIVRNFPSAHIREFVSLPEFTAAFRKSRSDHQPLPALVITGLSFGPGDMELQGVEVAELAKAAQVPVVALTGHHVSSLDNRFLDRFDAVVGKAHMSDEPFISLVGRLLELDANSQQAVDSDPVSAGDGSKVPSRAAGLDRIHAEQTQAAIAFQHVGEIVGELTLVDRIEGQGREVIAATVEDLLAQVRHQLHEGSWASAAGNDYGLEEDIKGDLDELGRQIRPLSDRPLNGIVIQGYVTSLSHYLLDLAAARSEGLAKERIAALRSAVVDRLSDVDGNRDATEAAKSALDSLAFATAWDHVDQPDEATDQLWDDFLRHSERNPAQVATELLGWLPANRREGASALLGGMTTAGGIGFLAQGVTAWVGAPAAATAGVGTVAGIVGAVVGAAAGVLSVRFVTGVADAGSGTASS